MFGNDAKSTQKLKKEFLVVFFTMLDLDPYTV